MIKKLLPNLLIAVSSIVLTYMVADAAYRIYRHYKLATEYQEYYFQATDVPLYIFDEQLGYRYRPNSRGTYANFDKDNSILQSNHYAVNNAGHISFSDDFVAKPSDEYRIAILGDSYTASVFNDIPWPTILETELNADATLKEQLGVRTFKVINFGMDGTGIPQWASLATNEVARFHPDLVVVNFITDDIYRRFIWRASVETSRSNGRYYLGLMCSSLPVTLENRDCAVLKMITLDLNLFDNQHEISQIKREIYEQEVDRLDWFNLYPELLARALGKPLGLRARLYLSNQQIPYYDSDDAAIAASSDALRKIKSMYATGLFLHNPDPPEVISGWTPLVVSRLAHEQGSPDITFMEKFLPSTTDEEEKRRWFKLPYDGHFSNYGAMIYAQAVYGQVREHLLSSTRSAQ